MAAAKLGKLGTSWDSCENLTFFKKLHAAASNFYFLYLEPGSCKSQILRAAPGKL
jgi:hypothetical protein